MSKNNMSTPNKEEFPDCKDCDHFLEEDYMEEHDGYCSRLRSYGSRSSLPVRKDFGCKFNTEFED